MPPSSFLREKYLVTCRFDWVDVHYADLPPPDEVLMLFVTNLRNRPLSISVTESMWDTVLSLYHNLVTGSKDFPFIHWQGHLTSFLLESPFNSMQQEWENTTPSPLTAAPPGMMVPTSGSGSAPANIFTPVLPEKTELGALKADRRNHVQLLQVGSSTVTRVISPVYRSDYSELTNRWRVTDYSAEGQVLMSVLCRFFNHPAQSARPLSQKRVREDTEDDGGSSSSSSPAGKRLRV